VRIADRQRLGIVRGLLEGLDARKRAVLVLHELEGLDTKEIADILDCPRSTVLTRLSRARHELIDRARAAGVSLEEG
jgi:RNA polymerase sigma factor (sigma-70 family)